MSTHKEELVSTDQPRGNDDVARPTPQPTPDPVTPKMPPQVPPQVPPQQVAAQPPATPSTPQPMPLQALPAEPAQPIQPAALGEIGEIGEIGDLSELPEFAGLGELSDVGEAGALVPLGEVVEVGEASEAARTERFFTSGNPDALDTQPVTAPNLVKPNLPLDVPTPAEVATEEEVQALAEPKPLKAKLPEPDLPASVPPASAAPAKQPDAATKVDPAAEQAPSVEEIFPPATRSAASERDILLEGATAVAPPKSRAAAHWGGVLLALALFPCAWFLLRDGAHTLTGGDASTWPTALSVAGLAKFGGGAAVLCLAVFMAHRSSLGSFVLGGIGLVIGLPFILAPGFMATSLGPTVERLQAHSWLGEALTTYAMADALTGNFALLGMFLIMLGLVSHRARRAGRREQESQQQADSRKR